MEAGVPPREFGLADWPCCDVPLQVCVELCNPEVCEGRFRWGCTADEPFARFRFSAMVLDYVAPPEVCVGRFRFAASVRKPSIPINTYQLCLNAAGSQYASGPNVSALDGATAFTVMFFATRAAPNAVISITQESGALTNLHQFTLWTDGYVYATLGDAGGYGYGYFGPANDTLRHHIAIVYDGTLVGNANRLKMFLDGVQQSMGFGPSIGSPVTTSGNLFYIGRRLNDGAYSTGDVDDLAIFPVALPPSVIAGIAAGTDDPSFHSPAALWRFEEGGGTTAADSSGNGLNLTLHNDAGFCVIAGSIITDTGFRWHADVVDYTPEPETLVASFRFAADVVVAVDDPPEWPGRFRFRGEVVFVPGVPGVIAAAFRFADDFSAYTATRSTQSIRTVETLEQGVDITNIGSFSTSGLTVCFWARYKGGNNGGIVSINGPMGTRFELRCTGEVDPVAQMEMSWMEGEDFKQVTSSGGDPIGLVWRHFAMVFDGAEPALLYYLDGELQDVILTGDALPTAWTHFDEVSTIGYNADGDFSDALFDDVLISLGAIGSEQIKGLAAGMLSPEDFAPIAYYAFENDVEGAPYDGAWGDLDHGTWVNDPDHSDDVPPVLNDSAGF